MPSSSLGHACYPYVSTIQCVCDSVGSVQYCVSRLMVGGGGVLSVRQGEGMVEREVEVGEGEMAGRSFDSIILSIGMVFALVTVVG